MSKNKASITAVLGASGSGKSRSIKTFLDAENIQRLLIWDMEAEYSKFAKPVTNSNQLIDILQGHKKFKIAYQIPDNDPRVDYKAEFDRFCGLAKKVGNLTVVVDELRFVTSPVHAPRAWSNVAMRGRHAGLSVIGASQRPASIDKDFLGNCTQITTFRLVYPDDRIAVAKAMNEPVTSVEALQEFECLTKNMVTGECVKVKMPW